LLSAFPGQIVVTGEATPDATGAFEVNVMPAAGGSHLVHSKIGGQGHVIGVDDSKEKLQKIIDSIRQLL